MREEAQRRGSLPAVARGLRAALRPNLSEKEIAAFHEAGHAVITSLALGLRVDRVYIERNSFGVWGGGSRFIDLQPGRTDDERMAQRVEIMLAGPIAGERILAAREPTGERMFYPYSSSLDASFAWQGLTFAEQRRDESDGQEPFDPGDLRCGWEAATHGEPATVEQRDLYLRVLRRYEDERRGVERRLAAWKTWSAVIRVAMRLHEKHEVDGDEYRSVSGLGG